MSLINTSTIQDVPENRKKMIEMKYDLKKIATQFYSGRSQIDDLKKKAGYKNQKDRATPTISKIIFSESRDTSGNTPN